MQLRDCCVTGMTGITRGPRKAAIKHAHATISTLYALAAYEPPKEPP
ncbi:MAG TPA: hypothetical protein VK025_12150 [Steroidobacter sp.]|nr:hypothetical protein [Steroidobacter sp.]